MTAKLAFHSNHSESVNLKHHPRDNVIYGAINRPKVSYCHVPSECTDGMSKNRHLVPCYVVLERYIEVHVKCTKLPLN